MSAATWPDGTLRSQSNFFNVVPRGIDAESAPLPRSRNPSPTIVLPGTRVLDRNGRRSVHLQPGPRKGSI